MTREARLGAFITALRGRDPIAAIQAEADVKALLPEIAEIAQTAAIAATAGELIDFVIEKYGVTSLDGFTCPIHRRLAEALGKFEKGGAE